MEFHRETTAVIIPMSWLHLAGRICLLAGCAALLALSAATQSFAATPIIAADQFPLGVNTTLSSGGTAYINPQDQYNNPMPQVSFIVVNQGIFPSCSYIDWTISVNYTDQDNKTTSGSQSKAQRGSEAARKDIRRDVRNATSLMLSSLATLQAANVALADTEHGQDHTYEHDVMAMHGALAQVDSTMYWGELAYFLGGFLLFFPLAIYISPRLAPLLARRRIAGSQSPPHLGKESQRCGGDSLPKEG